MSAMIHGRLVTRPASSRPTVEEACLEAFQGEFDYLYRTLRRLGAASSEVEDLAQEVFMVLHRTWVDYDASRPLRPYLFGIAYRIAFAHQRRRARERPLMGGDVEDGAAWPDRALQAKQDRALVLSALDRIPLPRRAVLVMHDIDEVSVQQIASVLSIPLFTAYSRLRKARKELEVTIRRLMKETTYP
jgi:RNA polymerase sigma-70 factor (ECF subfamily)